MEIDVDSWTRAKEVYNYATAHHMTVAEAINALVNTGLSHQRESYL